MLGLSEQTLAIRLRWVFWVSVGLSFLVLWGLAKPLIDPLIAAGLNGPAALIARLPTLAMAIGMIWGMFAIVRQISAAKRYAFVLALGLTAAFFLLVPYALNTPIRTTTNAYLALDMEWNGTVAPGRNIAFGRSRIAETGPIPGCDAMCQTFLQKNTEARLPYFPKNRISQASGNRLLMLNPS